MPLECDFIFDGIPSTEYGVQIMSLGYAPDTVALVADKEYITVRPPRSSKHTVLDVSDPEVLTFDVQIFPVNEDYLDNTAIKQISDWLFNKTNYAKLQVLTPELSHLYFNCILKSATKLMSADKVIGISFTAECDSNGGWTFPQKRVYDFSSKNVSILTFNNQSSEENGMRPILQIEMLEDGDFSLANTLSNQIVKINKLNNSEIITMDCENQIISSNLNRYLFDDFNGEFLFMPKGLNKMTVFGKCKITITYQNQEKVGW